MRAILNYIFSIILAICLIGISFVTIISNTVLNESYAIKTLEKEEYFNNVYWLVRANFENYIYQSGLNEEVLENIITKEKIKSDIKIVIENLYKGQDKQIDVSEIKENLNKNIENYIKEKGINHSQKEAIDEFVNQIADEYKSTITFYNIETKIGFNVEKIFSLIKLVKKLLLIFISIDFLILLVLNLNRMYKFVSWLGISFATNGFIMLFTNLFIRLRIKIKIITIINDFISEIIRKIIFDFLNIVTIYGICSLVIAIVLIVIANRIHNNKNETKEKI